MHRNPRYHDSLLSDTLCYLESIEQFETDYLQWIEHHLHYYYFQLQQKSDDDFIILSSPLSIRIPVTHPSPPIPTEIKEFELSYSIKKKYFEISKASLLRTKQKLIQRWIKRKCLFPVQLQNPSHMIILHWLHMTLPSYSEGLYQHITNTLFLEASWTQWISSFSVRCIRNLSVLYLKIKHFIKKVIPFHDLSLSSISVFSIKDHKKSNL